MFRLLGFLVGSAAAIAILLLLLGVPDFHLPDAADDRQRFEAAVEKLREKQEEVKEVAGTVVEEVATAVDGVKDGLEAAAEQALPEIAARVDAARTAAASDDAPAAVAAVSHPPAETDPAAPAAVPEFDAPEAEAGFDGELQWYSFWNPFRSELAANGFKSQLEKVTGLDYRVVKVRTGTYEVAFAYADDAERQSKLSQIALATGLNLPGS